MNFTYLFWSRKYENFESYSHNHSSDQDSELQSAVDPHIWLDTENAKVITQKIVHILSEFDPENAQKYIQWT